MRVGWPIWLANDSNQNGEKAESCSQFRAWLKSVRCLQTQ
jgi:hypothetical protein